MDSGLPSSEDAPSIASLRDCGRLMRFLSSDEGLEPNSESKDFCWFPDQSGMSYDTVGSKLTTLWPAAGETGFSVAEAAAGDSSFLSSSMEERTSALPVITAGCDTDDDTLTVLSVSRTTLLVISVCLDSSGSALSSAGCAVASSDTLWRFSAVTIVASDPLEMVSTLPLIDSESCRSAVGRSAAPSASSSSVVAAAGSVAVMSRASGWKVIS